MALGIIHTGSSPAPPFASYGELLYGEFTWSEVTVPGFVDPADRMVWGRLRIVNFSTPAPSAFLLIGLPAHSAYCACFALDDRASIDCALTTLVERLTSSAMEPFVPGLADTPGGSGRMLCQPTPGWKQSPGNGTGVVPLASELPLFPNLPVLRTATCLVGGPLCAV